jgi:S-adenosylmethionine-diacylgycerolhomoserine-N-methlytransferase
MTQTLGADSAAAKMDVIYRRQRFIYDATRRYYLFGRDRLIGDLQASGAMTVLEIGCGTARNLTLAARHYPEARLYGLDVSEEMLRSARSSIARHGFEKRIALAAGDATAFNASKLFGISGFDRIFFSYVLSMVPSWPDAVRHAATLVAPGGFLSILDFGDFTLYPALVRRAQLAWLRHFSVIPIPAFDSKITALAEQIGFASSIESVYGGYAFVARIERPNNACPQR